MASNSIELILKSIDSLTGDLKNVEAGLGKLTGAETKLAGASKDSTFASDKLSASLSALQLAVSPLAGGITKAVDVFQRFALALKAGAIPLAIAGIAAAGIGLAKSVADLGTEFLRLERVTGISVASLSGLKVVAEQNESSLEELSIGLRSFNRVLGQAVTAGGEARQTLIQLGITEQEVTSFYEDSEAALEAVAKRISALPSIIEKNRFAVQFFGRSGRDLLITLDEIAKNGLEGVRKKAEELGLLLTGNAAAAGKQFNDNLTTIKQNLDSLKVSLGGPILAALNDLVAGLTFLASFGTIKLAFSGIKPIFLDNYVVKDSLSKAIQAEIKSSETEGRIALGLSRGGKEGAAKILAEIKAALSEDELSALLVTGLGERGGRLAAQEIIKARKAAEKLNKQARDEADKADEERKKKKVQEQNEFAKNLEKQIAGLNAELSKSIAQSQIQLAGQLLDKTGDFETFITKVRKGIADIRAASAVSIDLQFKEESEKGDTATAAKARAVRLAQVNQQTRDIEVAALRQVAEFREKLADRRLKLETDYQSAIAEGSQAEIEFAKKALELGKDDITTLEQIVSETDKIAERMRALNQVKLDELETRITGLREKLDFSSLPPGSQAALSKALGVDVLPLTAEQVREINIEIVRLTTEAQKTKTGFLEIGDAAADIAKKVASARLLGGIETQGIRLKTQLSEVNDSLDEIRKKAAIESLSDSSITVPWNKVLEIARQIDKVQQDILANEIKRQQVAVEIARIGSDTSDERRQKLDAEIAKLEDLQTQARLALGKTEKEQLSAFAKEVDQIAGDMAKSFVDRLISGLEAGKLDIKAILSGIGRAVLADLLQTGLKSLLKPVVEEQLRAGQKPSDTLGGGIIGNFKAAMKGIFGIEFDKTATSTPLEKAAMDLPTVVGTALTPPSEKLSLAGSALVEAGNVLTRAAQMMLETLGVRANGEGIAIGGAPALSAPPSSRDERDQEELAVGIEQTQRLGAASLETGNVITTLGQTGGQLNTVLQNMTGQGNSVLKTFSGLVTGVGQLFGLFSQLPKLLSGGGDTGGGGILDTILGFGKSILGLLKFSHGGIVTHGLPAFASGGVPGMFGTDSIPIQKLKTGRVIGGPVAGVFGEEGSELVAKIKPSGSGDFGGQNESIQQNIFIVDQRRPNLGPRDVQLIISDDMSRGGVTSRGVQNVLKRHNR